MQTSVCFFRTKWLQDQGGQKPQPTTTEFQVTGLLCFLSTSLHFSTMSIKNYQYYKIGRVPKFLKSIFFGMNHICTFSKMYCNLLDVAANLLEEAIKLGVNSPHLKMLIHSIV